MNILFLCKHNRFRSKVAEAIFKKLNKNKKIKVKSRGIIKDVDVADSVIKVMREKGYDIKDKKSIRVEDKDISWIGIIVIVADNVRLKIKNKKVIRWKISDTNQNNVKGIRERVEEIERKVKKLVEKLENKKV